MATKRICDRCGADVERVLDGTPKSVVVPPSSPSTTPVAAAVNLELAVKSPNDLCDPCVVSALIELALSTLQVPIALIVDALRARAKVAGKGGG